MVDIKLKQYTYLAVNSESLSCNEIEAELGIAADEHTILGAKRHANDPSYPLVNSWRLIHNKNIPIDDQIDFLIKRLLPSKNLLIDLVDDNKVEVTLEVVRHFDDDEGENEQIDENVDLIKLSGQHQLLGWSISAENLAILASLHATLDVDEYN